MINRRSHATALFVAMLSIYTIGHAHAHDYQHPELNGWYQSLHSGKGPCCDGSNAKRVIDADWDIQDRHWRGRGGGGGGGGPGGAGGPGPGRAGRAGGGPDY